MSDVDVRPSSIEGLGIFATRPFTAGEQIARINVVREITAEAPIRPDLGEQIEHCAYPDGKVVLIASPERHVNHSCEPNAWERFEENGSSLVARRGIAADEESRSTTTSTSRMEPHGRAAAVQRAVGASSRATSSGCRLCCRSARSRL